MLADIFFFLGERTEKNRNYLQKFLLNRQILGASLYRAQACEVIKLRGFPRVKLGRFQGLFYTRGITILIRYSGIPLGPLLGLAHLSIRLGLFRASCGPSRQPLLPFRWFPQLSAAWVRVSGAYPDGQTFLGLGWL